MSNYWNTHEIIPETMGKVGPFLDGIVGTDGEYTDLYAAINTGGWKRMIITLTATLSQDLTISASSGFIISEYPVGALSLNNHKITVTGNYWKFAGITLNGAGCGWELQGSGYTMIDCGAISATSHGLYINSSSGGFCFLRCAFQSCGGDGIRNSSGSTYNQIIGCRSYGNTGWGLNSLVTGSGFPIVQACRLGANTAGSVSGSITEGNYKP